MRGVRFVCLLAEHLPIHVEALRDPTAAAGVVVILRAWDRRVLDATPDALACGLKTGDSQHRVEQLCPESRIITADEITYQRYHDQLGEILAGFAGAVEHGGLGVLFGEISALARTFPSEKALALQLVAQAQRTTGLPVSLGVAANKFTALQAARQATDRTGAVTVVPQGGEASFLAPLPLSVLPDMPVEMLSRLHLLGITTLGGMARLPRAAVMRQFGVEAARLHQLARGEDMRPLVPQSPPPLIVRRIVLPEPLTERSLLLTAAEHLAGQVARTLERGGYQAEAITWMVTTTDGQLHTDGAHVKPPSADGAHLRRLVGRLLGRAELTAPVNEMALAAYPLRDWYKGARQLILFESEATSPRLARLHEVLRMLRQKFGEMVINTASWIGPPLPLPIVVETDVEHKPLRLRWGGWSRRVVDIYEIWREQRRWWEQPIVREYYYVETDAGTFFTIFRDLGGNWFLDRCHR